MLGYFRTWRQAVKAKNITKRLESWQVVDETEVPSLVMVEIAVRRHNAMFRDSRMGEGTTGTLWSGAQVYGGTTRGGAIILPPTNGSPVRNYPSGSYSGGPPKANDTWTCEVADVTGCPILKVEPVIEVPYELYNAWIDLAGDYDTEWLAYLQGEVNQQTGRARLTEMYFPKQDGKAAHVERPDDSSVELRPGTIAAVHSHVKMQAFFSQEDIKHANWPVEIVINAKGEYECSMRMRLECGRFQRIKGKIILVGLKAGDVYRAALDEALKPEATRTEGVTSA